MGMSYETFIFHLLFLKPLIVCGIFAWGPCPSIPVDIEKFVSSKSDYFYYSVGNFQAAEYLGTWYGIIKTVDFPWSSGNCTQTLYYVRDDGRVAVLNSEIINGNNISMLGEVFVDAYIPGQLYPRFFRYAPLGDYKVVHTDYTRTALVFTCRSFGIFHWKYVWVIARDFNTEEVPSYYEIIESLGIPINKLVKTNHKNC